MTLKKFNPREYFRKKKVAVLTNISDEIIHHFLKKEFRSYETASPISCEQIISVQSFHFFLTQLAQFGIHISNKREENDLVIAVLTYEFHDEYHTKISALAVLVGKDEVYKKQIIFVESFEEKLIRILSIELLKKLYEELKTPCAFK